MKNTPNEYYVERVIILMVISKQRSNKSKTSHRMCRTILLLCFLLLTLCSVGGNRVEEELDEVVRRAVSLDFTLYDRKESYLINIINQDGYRICTGTIDRNQMKQINCIYRKESLKHGENIFYITIYSRKNKRILFETTAGYYYENIGTNIVVKKVSNLFKSSIERLRCAVLRDDTCLTIPDGTGKVVLGIAAAATAVGITSTYIYPIFGSVAHDKDDSVFPAIYSGIDDSDDSSSPPPSDHPPPRCTLPRQSATSIFRTKLSQVSHSPIIRTGGMLFVAVLANRDRLIPALTSTYQQIRTSKAIFHYTGNKLSLPPYITETLKNLQYSLFSLIEKRRFHNSGEDSSRNSVSVSMI